MKNTLYTILISGLLLGASILPTKAFASCQEVYGGGQVCNNSYTFSIEKLVQTPGKGGDEGYVNNLSINSPKYSPSQNVSFKITVKNTGGNTIPAVNVSDTFPQFLSFVSGPGSFNSNSKVLTFTVNNLEAGKSQTYTVVGKVSDANILPSDQGIICMINQALGTDNNGVSNSSSSQFCVQKSVLGATPILVTTPATGPEMLPLISLIPAGLAGFILRKKSIKK